MSTRRHPHKRTRQEPCTGCGKRGRTEAPGPYQCRPCRQLTRQTIYDASHALPPGRWIVRGGVRHFQIAEEAVA